MRGWPCVEMMMQWGAGVDDEMTQGLLSGDVVVVCLTTPFNTNKHKQPPLFPRIVIVMSRWVVLTPHMPALCT